MTAIDQSRGAPTRPTAAPRQLHVFAAVVRRVLRDQRRSPVTWGLALGLMSALELAIYPGVHESLNKAMTSYPDALKDAFRLQSVDSPAQFVNGEMFTLIVPIAIGLFAVRAASRAIAGYEERHWLDIVLSTPVRRRTLLAGAFTASAIMSAAIMIVTGAIIWIAGEVFGAVVSLGDVAQGVVGVMPFAVFFAGVGALLGGRLGDWGVVTGIGSGLIVAMYVIDVAARITDSLHDIGPLSAFHYYGSPLTDGIDLANFAGLLLAGIALAAVGAVLFERRDVHG